MDVHQRSINAYEAAAAGKRGRQGTLVRLAWIYLNVDRERIPMDRAPYGRPWWERDRFPSTRESIIEEVDDARHSGDVRDHIRKLTRWLPDHLRS